MYVYCILIQQMTTTYMYNVGIPGSGLEQTHTCCGVNGKWNPNPFLLIIGTSTAIHLQTIGKKSAEIRFLHKNKLR